jgi:hypothetical protein
MNTYAHIAFVCCVMAGLVCLEGRRIIALGDVHGDIYAMHSALEASSLVDSDGTWIGRDAVLVQTGDQLDRGADELRILDFLERLQGEAQQDGGDVIILNGNHEFMNALGDFRYVTQEGFESFNHYAAFLSPELAKRLPAHAHGRAHAFLPGGAMLVGSGEVVI